MIREFIICFLMLASVITQAQNWGGQLDSSSNLLLKNRYVEIEATQAMHDMYNMDFDRAARQYNYLKKLYGWHPLPYFLLGLNEWWKLLPYGITDETEWDATFLAYMDSAEVLSKRLYEEVHELEGAFFLSAVYAFQGRLYSDRGDYVKAALVGKKCLKYLEITRGNSEFSPEILFGDALFNYYAKWIREHYPYLKPLMAFFPDGDKKKGIAQLEETARNAFYSRTEAQYYLMRILYAEEGDLEGALQIARYLHEQYPNNAYFHRFFVRLTYQKGNFKEAEEEALEIIQRIDLGWPGYEWNSGRYAGFFLGHIYEIYKNPEDAMKYYGYAIEYGELAETTDAGYYIYSHLHIARILEREDRLPESLTYYEKLKKITRRKHPANGTARNKIKELKKKV